MKLIYDHSKDPVFVGESRSGKNLFLQIGESKRGHCRYVMLSPRQTRIVAYSLLAKAEQKDAELAAKK